ncbi:SAM hydrolase/SAM-dependent halogenase family protein [Candidatus Mycalebacterium sp.]
MSGVIAICSDFGSRDHFTGVMKGVILSINPKARLVDLACELDSFNVRRAAFVIKNSYPFFRPQTVHLAVVDPGVGSGRKPIAVQAGENFFVGPDNGIFTHVFKNFPSFSAYEIENPAYTLKATGSTFHGRDIFAPAAAHLSLGVKPSELGRAVEKPVMLEVAETVILNAQTVEGIAVYADAFGNLISNIAADGIENPVEVEIAGTFIDGVSDSYSSRAPGKAVAVRGSSGFLEIAVNKGGALERFGGEGTKIIVRKKT